MLCSPSPKPKGFNLHDVREFLLLMSSRTTLLKLAFFAFLSPVFTACTPDFEGEYSDPAKTEIVDDKWNETDARKTAVHLRARVIGTR